MKQFERFTLIEPESTLGFVSQAMCLQQEIVMGWAVEPKDSIARMGSLLERAISMDPDDPSALGYAGMHKILLGEHDAALRLAERAVEIAPHIDGPYYTLGWYQMFAGDPIAAIENLKHSMRLTPVVTAPRTSVLGTCYRNSEQMDLALETLEDSIIRDPDFLFARVVLASCYSAIQDQESAEAQVSEILHRDPSYTIARYVQPNLYRDPGDKDRWADALRSAGLPVE